MYTVVLVRVLILKPVIVQLNVRGGSSPSISSSKTGYSQLSETTKVNCKQIFSLYVFFDSIEYELLKVPGALWGQ